MIGIARVHPLRRSGYSTLGWILIGKIYADSQKMSKGSFANTDEFQVTIVVCRPLERVGQTILFT